MKLGILSTIAITYIDKQYCNSIANRTIMYMPHSLRSPIYYKKRPRANTEFAVIDHDTGGYRDFDASLPSTGSGHVTVTELSTSIQTIY